MHLLWQGLLLGLSTGLFCLGACAPALVPALLVGQRGWRGSAAVVAQVAGGRLLAYLIFGAAVGALGTALDPGSQALRRLGGVAMLLLALVLAAHLAGLGPRVATLPVCRLLPARVFRAPWAFGFLTGLSVCPPFLLALATALGAGGPLEGALFFAAFFAGTALYLLPLVPLGALGRWEAPRLVGRIAGMLAAGLFAVLGLGQVLLA
ncbi:MAG: sulfite exporter TauE/SafE family protein [Chloroflexi bacterium]|nr:sulfite exporter TauE/SafE family protein [Chloroflexota bacterium]